jgi:hypothetical protein
MTPKQRYDERKRLRIERDIRALERSKSQAERQDDMDAQVVALVASFSRIADVMELWADLQADVAR